MKTRPSLVLVSALLQVLLAALWVQGDSRCFDVDTNNQFHCEDVNCKIVKLKPGQAACATATQFVIRDLKPGEQMCCTKTEAVVRKVEPGAQLICTSLEADLYDRHDEENTPEHYRMTCGLASKAVHSYVNLYKYQKLVCTAVESFIIENLDDSFGAACTNNRCFRAKLEKGEVLLCKRFNLPPGVGEFRLFNPRRDLTRDASTALENSFNAALSAGDDTPTCAATYTGGDEGTPGRTSGRGQLP